MGAGVAELKEQLAAVNVQLATAVLPTAKRVELLAQKAALEAELKAAQAKKSAASASGGAYGLLCSFSRALYAVHPAPSPARPPRPFISHNTLFDASLPSLLCSGGAVQEGQGEGRCVRPLLQLPRAPHSVFIAPFAARPPRPAHLTQHTL
jgi:hypothetical protein